MKQFLLLLTVTGFILLSSCRKDFSTQPSTGQLEFSKDTVFLDTIFNDIGSSTYTLKVYNRSKNDISIPNIQLKNGENSRYRLNVDGIPGKSFQDIDILAQDSIFVFVEVTVKDVSDIELVYEDELVFDSGDRRQDVKLVTLVKDAVFLYPDKNDGIIETLLLGVNDEGEEIRKEGRYLTDEELIFTNEKPYVIYGHMMVGTPDNDAFKTLIVEAGANIHFHKNSGLYIGEKGSLQVQGSLNIEGQPQTEVVFQGDRLEPVFENEAGQWDGINFLPGSVNNSIHYATIKNGTTGLFLLSNEINSTPTLEVNNTQIYNQSSYGILSFFSNIKASNLVINNCAGAGFVAIVGGIYNFTHCTIANSLNQRSIPNIWLRDNITINDELITASFHELNFTNCIIDGASNIELGFDKQATDTAFNMHFSNNLIKFNDTQNTYDGQALYDFNNTDLYINNVFNGFLDYKNLSLNELIIGDNSDAKGKASLEGTLLVPFDILGKTRANPADVGAYESIIFEE